MNQTEEKTLGKVITESLTSYRLKHQEVPDYSGGINLIDALTPDWSDSIKPGAEEVELLADHLYTDIKEHTQSRLSAILKHIDQYPQSVPKSELKSLIEAELER